VSETPLKEVHYPLGALINGFGLGAKLAISVGQ
jgi:hypothetical protein